VHQGFLCTGCTNIILAVRLKINGYYLLTLSYIKKNPSISFEPTRTPASLLCSNEMGLWVDISKIYMAVSKIWQQQVSKCYDVRVGFI
jgi:hypothetical protein